VRKVAKRILYRIVDSEGDEIKPELFTRNVNIPVTPKSVSFADGAMVITLEYLHGGGERAEGKVPVSRFDDEPEPAGGVEHPQDQPRQDDTN
jgi:hypothetical protein